MFYAPVNSFTYIEAVSSGMLDETGVPGENPQPTASELTNLLTLRSA